MAGKKKRTKKKSKEALLIANWTGWQKFKDKEILEFMKLAGYNINRKYPKKLAQSIITKYILYKKLKQKQSEEKTNIKDITKTPQNISEQVHGGSEHQHKDIDEANDKNNEGKKGNKHNDPEKKKSSDSLSPQKENEKGENNNQNISFPFRTPKTSKSKKKKKRKGAEKKEGSGSRMGNMRGRRRGRRRYTPSYSRSIEYHDIVDIKMFRSMKHIINRLYASDSAFGRTNKMKKWDARKIVKSKFDYQYKKAKTSTKPAKRVWLILDDSGSVIDYSDMILGIAEGSFGKINVVSGSEAKPLIVYNLKQFKIPKNISLYDLKRNKKNIKWTQPFSKSFTKNLEAFLSNNVQKGDMLIFFGDLYDATNKEDTPAKLRKLFRNTKNYFLLTHEYDTRSDVKLFKDAKNIKIFYNITTPSKFIRALKEIAKSNQ